MKTAFMAHANIETSGVSDVLLPDVLLATKNTDSPFNLYYGPRRDKTCLRGFANNKGADQPAHPRRLISAFVIRLLESFISKIASSEMLIF